MKLEQTECYYHGWHLGTSLQNFSHSLVKWKNLISTLWLLYFFIRAGRLVKKLLTYNFLFSRQFMLCAMFHQTLYLFVRVNCVVKKAVIICMTFDAAGYDMFSLLPLNIADCCAACYFASPSRTKQCCRLAGWFRTEFVHDDTTFIAYSCAIHSKRARWNSLGHINYKARVPHMALSSHIFNPGRALSAGNGAHWAAPSNTQKAVGMVRHELHDISNEDKVRCEKYSCWNIISLIIPNSVAN
jgi:hypothetical protein